MVRSTTPLVAEPTTEPIHSIIFTGDVPRAGALGPHRGGRPPREARVPRDAHGGQRGRLLPPGREPHFRQEPPPRHLAPPTPVAPTLSSPPTPTRATPSTHPHCMWRQAVCSILGGEVSRPIHVQGVRSQKNRGLLFALSDPSPPPGARPHDLPTTPLGAPLGPFGQHHRARARLRRTIWTPS